MLCCRIGCKREAQCAPKLCVPATGIAIDLHRPLEAMLALPLCNRHFDELSAPAWLSDGGHGTERRAIFEHLAASIRGPPPDFDRAWFTKVRLDSSLYQTFQRMAGTLPPKAPKPPPGFIHPAPETKQ